MDKPPLRETLDLLIGETQFFRQTLAVHAREPLSVAQIVHFDGDFEQNIVRGMEPVAEPNYMGSRNAARLVYSAPHVLFPRLSPFFLY